MYSVYSVVKTKAVCLFSLFRHKEKSVITEMLVWIRMFQKGESCGCVTITGVTFPVDTGNMSPLLTLGMVRFVPIPFVKTSFYNSENGCC